MFAFPGAPTGPPAAAGPPTAPTDPAPSPAHPLTTEEALWLVGRPFAIKPSEFWWINSFSELCLITCFNAGISLGLRSIS